MCALRLEVLNLDLLHLQAMLCRFFRFCKRLPSIPTIIPTGLRPSPDYSPWGQQALLV